MPQFPNNIYFGAMIIPAPTTVDFSTIESGLIGLKIGRCNHDSFNTNELYSQITEGHYDLCRLKVPAEDEYATARLHQTGLPYFFSGSIRKYRTCIAEYPKVHYQYSDLVFELYDGTQDQLLKDMLVDTWGQYPLGYYRTPYTSELVTKAQEIECVYQYYKKYNLNKDYPLNQILFMKHGEKYVGIFTLNTVGNTLECNLAGILKPYRSDGYFHDEMNFKKEYCIKHGLEYFTFGARNENAAVQKIFQHLDFQTAGNDNVFHIPSLLTYSKATPVLTELKPKEMDYGKLSGTLYHEASLLAQQHLPVKSTMSFQLNHPEILLKEEAVTIRFSVPVVIVNEVLVVMRSENEKGKEFTGYLRLSKN